MLEQVNNLMGRILISGEEKSWDYGFLESIEDQLNKGRTLSPRPVSYTHLRAHET